MDMNQLSALLAMQRQSQATSTAAPMQRAMIQPGAMAGAQPGYVQGMIPQRVQALADFIRSRPTTPMQPAAPTQGAQMLPVSTSNGYLVR